MLCEARLGARWLECQIEPDFLKHSPAARLGTARVFSGMSLPTHGFCSVRFSGSKRFSEAWQASLEFAAAGIFLRKGPFFFRCGLGFVAFCASGCVKPNADFDLLRLGTTANVTQADASTSNGDAADSPTTQDGDATSSPSELTTEPVESESDSDSATGALSSAGTSNETTSSASTTSSTMPSAGSCTPMLCYALNDQRSVVSSAVTVLGRAATAFELPGDRRALRVELFTGESSAASRLAIWSSNGDRPGSELVGQAWTLDPLNQWQGATFSEPFALSGQTRYWVVWDTPANAQASMSTSGEIPTHSFQRQGETSWSSENERPMFRLYCCDA